MSWVNSGGTRMNVQLDPVTTPPTAPWYFWIYQGSAFPAAAVETEADEVEVRVTMYRTVKFFGRGLLTL